MRIPRRRSTVAVIATLLTLIAPACAQAAWPGRDGLLAVQPARGGGILLVTPGGRIRQRVCPELTGGCEVASDPVFSPDGRKLALGSPRGWLSIVYADGSCLSCRIEYSGDGSAQGPPVFDSDGRRLLFDSDPSRTHGLWIAGEDGIGLRSYLVAYPGRPLAVGAGGFAPAVSADHRIAFVRRIHKRDWVFVSNRAQTRATALGPGDRPAWAPDGRSLAFDDGGWVQRVRSRGGSARALARGSAPAWSPSGRTLAFLDPGGYVSAVPAGGGRAHRVGVVRGAHVDWQPVVPGPPRCDPPPGSTMVVQAAEVTVTSTTDQGGNRAYMACWRPHGILRLLDSAFGYSTFDIERVLGFVTAGHYVAFRHSSYSFGEGTSDDVIGFDLSRGTLFDDIAGHTNDSSKLDQPTGDTGTVVTAFGLDALLASTDGGVAWLAHTTSYTTTTTTTTSTTTSANAQITIATTSVFRSNPQTSYEIDAHDGRGRRTLDAAIRSGPVPPLAGLRVSGDTVIWLHDGASRSAPLAGASSHVIAPR